MMKYLEQKKIEKPNLRFILFAQRGVEIRVSLRGFKKYIL